MVKYDDKECNAMKKVTVSITLCAALLFSSVTGTMTAVHASASKQEAAMLIAGLIDKQTGLRFFQWYPNPESHDSAYVVVKDKEGHWFRLNENLGMPFNTMINAGDGIQEPEYGIPLRNKPAWYLWLMGDSSYYYHLKDQIIYKGLSFYWSPDHQYGYTVVNSPNKGNWRGYSLLVKEASTGEIRELIRSDDHWEGLYWLDGKHLIMCKYNRTTNQNELLLLDAETGSVKHFAYGSLKGVDPVRREVLFVYNEPTRTKYILETATGKVRKAAEEEEKSFERQLVTYDGRIRPT